jgi:APA family basic amino acid/polyamine antiporter
MAPKSLVRGLSLIDATSLVVGTIIGTGVFLKSATMAQQVGSPNMVLLVWVVAGLLSLAGALTYAELGAMYPHAGGEYVYLREAYGDVPAFLYGWTRFWIAGPATIAAYAIGAATFLDGAASLDAVGGKVIIGFGFIFFFTALNCLQVSVGGRLQSFITGVKLLMMAALILGVLFYSDSASMSNLATPDAATAMTVSGFGLAMLSALWAYDGWNNLPMAAGEVKDPARNVPLSLIIGVLVVLVIYLLINFGYFLALPFAEALSANSDMSPDALPIATKAAVTFLGPAAIGIVSIGFMISALGAMNGSVLTCARVPYAMATDRLFFRQLGFVHPKTSVPVVSVVLQGGIAATMAFFGSFDQLSNYVVFSSWIFYGLVCAGVFILRKKRPDVARPYKTLGYPVVPAIFVLVSIFLVGNTIYELPKDTGIGIALIALGIPFYYALRAFWKRDQIPR